MTEFDLSQYLAAGRSLVDAALERALPARESDPLRLMEGMRYAVLQGGKRMRPLVVLAAAEACNASAEAAIPAVCALELVHAYSLVHDDLPAMDDDAERRGRPTVHIAFGEGAAVLIGDALLTEAFRILARDARGPARVRVADSVEILSKHSGIDGMVGGQGLDLALGQDIGELAALERVHALKTGGLYAASAALGALASNCDDATLEALERWGLCFGIAFQHADDALDDEQPALRDRALRRVDELVAECQSIASSLDGDTRALRAIAQWVSDRAHRAAAGDKRD